MAGGRWKARAPGMQQRRIPARKAAGSVRGGVGLRWGQPVVGVSPRLGSARGRGQPVGLLHLPGWGGERLLLKTREARVAIGRIQMQGWC